MKWKVIITLVPCLSKRRSPRTPAYLPFPLEFIPGIIFRRSRGRLVLSSLAVLAVNSATYSETYLMTGKTTLAVDAERLYPMAKRATSGSAVFLLTHYLAIKQYAMKRR